MATSVFKLENFITKYSKSGNFMFLVLLSIACVHIFLFVFFMFIQIYEMLFLNIYSLISYSFAMRFAIAEEYKKAYVLTYTEMMIHGLFGTYITGFDSGFNLVLACLFFMQFSFFSKSTCYKLTVFKVFILLLLYFQRNNPLFVYYKYLENDYYHNIHEILYPVNFSLMVVFMVIYGMFSMLVPSKKISDLKALVYTDFLTGLYNRKYFNDVILPTINGSKPLCVCICDIDNFKKINDIYGHDAGDVVLKVVSLIITSISSKNYKNNNVKVLRWGGEEFVIICEFDDYHKANEFLNTIKDEIFNYHIIHIDKSVSATFGGVFIKNPNKALINEYIKVADENLYKGKKSTKNTVILTEF